MIDPKTEFIEYELACLWSELEREERCSLTSSPAVPSMGMEWVMERIKMATALIGPIGWVSVPVRWLVAGRYEYWARYMEIGYSFPTEEELSMLKSSLREVDLGENF